MSKQRPLFWELQLRTILKLSQVEPNTTIAEIKTLLHKIDDDVLEDLPVGPRPTVFLAECLGTLFIYLLFYYRLPYIYGHKYDFTRSPFKVLASCCHSLHYIKRLVETILSIAFLTERYLYLCLYCWGFAAWQAYYIIHPLFTPPTFILHRCFSSSYLFVHFIQVCEFGHFSVHLILNRISCNGSRPTEIPYPTNNPFTWLFFFLSCPNYTYEVYIWNVGVFAFLGFIQMTIWAWAKHKTYIEQFKDSPDLRTAIILLFF
uniref:Trans-2,3-enoyl-CoA reductase-like 2b n=1 Tax=Sinocyclocheilus anshuiensis TaxID=1608454 RepID=A0A671S1Z6_9TELE